jgi:hypothetical protein
MHTSVKRRATEGKSCVLRCFWLYGFTGFARKVPYAEKLFPAKTQSAAAFFEGFLCPFAPWREKFSLHLGPAAIFRARPALPKQYDRLTFKQS